MVFNGTPWMSCTKLPSAFNWEMSAIKVRKKDCLVGVAAITYKASAQLRHGC